MAVDFVRGSESRGAHVAHYAPPRAFFALIRLKHLGIVDQPAAGQFCKSHAVLLPNSESAAQTLALEGAGSDAFLLFSPLKATMPFGVDFQILFQNTTVSCYILVWSRDHMPVVKKIREEANVCRTHIL